MNQANSLTTANILITRRNMNKQNRKKSKFIDGEK